jgi:hypothetical protein
MTASGEPVEDNRRDRGRERDQPRPPGEQQQDSADEQATGGEGTS